MYCCSMSDDIFFYEKCLSFMIRYRAHVDWTSPDEFFFRVVALVIHARACFERFWPEMERNARDCVLLAVCWVCSDVRLRVINLFLLV